MLIPISAMTSQLTSLMMHWPPHSPLPRLYPAAMWDRCSLCPVTIWCNSLRLHKDIMWSIIYRWLKSSVQFLVQWAPLDHQHKKLVDHLDQYLGVNPYPSLSFSSPTYTPWLKWFRSISVRVVGGYWWSLSPVRGNRYLNVPIFGDWKVETLGDLWAKVEHF